MEKQVIKSAEAAAPPPLYSQAIKAGGFVFVAGQIAQDPKTGDLVEGDIQTQTEVVFRTIEKILKEAGSGLAQVVKTTVYLSSPADYAGMNEVYAKFLSDSPPARATVAVTFLARSVRVEIDAIAIVSE